MFNFEKLEVYKQARQKYVEAEKLIENRKLSFVLSDQLARAHLSVVLNIAEGNSRMTLKDKNKFYIYARSSTAECLAIYDCLLLSGRINSVEFHSLQQALGKISYMLFKMIKK